MDMRDMRMMGDGRRLPPRNSRGEFRRRRRGDRGMDEYDMAMRGRGGRGGDRGMYDMRGDYATVPPINPQHPNVSTSGATRDYRGDYGYDGHYGHRQGGYQPVEFMGYCSGYYGSPDQDYGRGDYGDMRYDMRRDYGDMRGRRDYGYDMRMDYGYRDYGDYGETLSEEELEKWCHKLKSKLGDQERQIFSKEMISQKAKQMGKQMQGFGEKELEVATLMTYTDYKHTIGQNNVDMSIKLAFDWLNDDDVAVKGAEKLAVYYDCIVEGE